MKITPSAQAKAELLRARTDDPRLFDAYREVINLLAGYAPGTPVDASTARLTRYWISSRKAFGVRLNVPGTGTDDYYLFWQPTDEGDGAFLLWLGLADVEY